MKTICSVLLIIFLGAFCEFTLPKAHADVKDLGDLCLTLDDGGPRPPTGLRLGVLVYGENHIVLTGDGIQPEHGTAVLNGNNIIVTLNSSYVSADSSISLFSVTHLIINSSTLQGTFTIMTFDPTTSGQGTVTKGTVRISSCQ